MKNIKISKIKILAFFCLMYLIPLSAYAKRYALLVGMSDYKESTGWSRLESIPRELESVKRLLEHELKYDVIIKKNKSKIELIKIVEDFIGEYGMGEGNNNQLIFFFAGHGYTETVDDEQKGYFMPYNAPIKSRDKVGFYKRSISLDFFTFKAKNIHAKQVLFIFDSCFSGSVFNTRGVKRGIDELENLKGSPRPPIEPARYFITSGAADQQVPAKSIFIPALINAFKNQNADYTKDGYITSEELGMYLKAQVSSASAGAYTPQYAPLADIKYRLNTFIFDVSSMSPSKPGFKEGEGESDEMRRLRAEIEALKVAQAELQAELKKPPKVSPPGPIVTKGKAGIAWVRIPAGSFKMGSSEGDSNEKPVHSVRVRSFLMSKTEVTVGQYRRCVEAGRCTPADECRWGSPNWTSSPSDKEDHPINCVDWGQARTFAKWVGVDVDLPTEAEWEYAARGGQNFKYAGSNDADEVAWYTSNTNNTGTRAVGTKKANGFGLHDMSGNVWEWTLDEYHRSYSRAPSDGSAWGYMPTCRTGCDKGSAGRVNRGGGWADAADLRVAVRLFYSPDGRYDYLGFRLRRTLP